MAHATFSGRGIGPTTLPLEEGVSGASLLTPSGEQRSTSLFGASANFVAITGMKPKQIAAKARARISVSFACRRVAENATRTLPFTATFLASIAAEFAYRIQLLLPHWR